MEKCPRRLPIFDINNDLYPKINPYPIQPYKMGINDCASLPSPIYKNIVSYYHQNRISEDTDPFIYPSKGCAIVCIISRNKANAVLVGSPTIPRAAEYVVQKCICFVAIFWPDSGYDLFADFINEATDAHIPLEKIYPTITAGFTEKMASALSFSQRVYIFENYLDRMLSNCSPIPVQHKRLLNKISNFSDSPLASPRRKLLSPEFSGRHVRRLCVKYIGITPKLLARISRYQKTLHILNVNPSINQSDLAVDMGYADQSHFIKEFKTFHNATPVEFLSQFAGR